MFLIFQCNIPKEVGHGLIVVDTTDGFSKEDAYINCSDLVTLHLLNFVRHCVGNHNLHYYVKKNLITMIVEHNA